jgi:hypothetical protein
VDVLLYIFVGEFGFGKDGGLQKMQYLMEFRISEMEGPV